MASRKPLTILQAIAGELPAGDDLLLSTNGSAGARFNNGTFGVAHYMDSGSYYLLLTPSGSPLSSAWTALRPFTLNLTTGLVTHGNGLAVTGGLSADRATVSGLLDASFVKAAGSLSAAQWQVQGGYCGWNYTSGGGETDLVNSRGGGGGGFNFYNVDSTSSSTPALLMSLSGAGVLSLPLAPLPVASGGTGGATQAAARTGLGLATVAATGAYGDLLNAPAIPAASAAAPAMDGTATAGTSSAFSRGDHAHPTDSTRYAASNPSGYQTAANVTATVNTAITNLVNSAPAALDTLGEIANQLANDESAASALTTTVAGKVSKAGDTVPGVLNMTASGTQVRHNNGTYSLLQYIDSANFYLLLTNQNDPLGNFNSLRPFSVNVSTGQVAMSNGVSVAGGLTMDALGVQAASQASPFVNLSAGGTDAKYFDVLHLTSSIQFRFVNDARNAANAWLSVARTGYSATTITLLAPTINLSGFVQVSNGVGVAGGLTSDASTVNSNGQARRLFNSTNGAADQKVSDILTDGTNWLFRLLNDAQSAANTWLQVVRSGYTAASITLTAAVITLAGLTKTQRLSVGGGAGALTAADWATQGGYVGWAVSGARFSGSTVFVNSKGSGGGGFEWFNAASSANSTLTKLADLGPDGTLTLPLAPLPVNSGGTGATTPAGALVALGAFSANGGNVAGPVIVAGLVSGYPVASYAAPVAAQWQTQGGYLGWNYSGGGGETDFINSRGGGGGGFRWYDTASAANAVPNLLATLDGGGNLSLTGGAAASDLNVAGTGSMAGVWNSYQATVSASTGAITTAVATVRYKKLGRTVYFNLYANITNNGSGAGALSITLPFANNSASPLMLLSRDLNSLTIVSGYISTGATALAINRVVDNAYPIAANGAAGFAFSGVYEAAA